MGRLSAGEVVEELSNLGGCHLDILGDLVFDTSAEEVDANHAVVLFLEFIIREACSLAEGFFGAILLKVAAEVVVEILLHLLLRHLDTVDLALVNEQLGKNEVFEDGATGGMGIGNGGVHAHLSQ